MFYPWPTDLLVCDTKSDYLFYHDNSKVKLSQLTNISLWSDFWLWVSMEAGEPHGKDLVFERDFDDRFISKVRFTFASVPSKHEKELFLW